MSSGPLAIIMETPAPLVCGVVNNALLHSRPTINYIHCLKLSRMILHFLFGRLAAALYPNFIFNWIEFEVVGRSKICRDECRSSLALKEVDRLPRPVLCGSLAEQLRTRQIPDVWQAATVVTVVTHRRH